MANDLIHFKLHVSYHGSAKAACSGPRLRHFPGSLPVTVIASAVGRNPLLAFLYAGMWPGTQSQVPSPPVQSQVPRRPDVANLRQWFAKLDKDANGRISVTELQAALAEGGLNFSLGTTAAIIRQCDSTGTGTIAFSDFERLHTFLATVQETFDRLRPDSRTGRVPLEEVARGLAAFGYNLEPEAERALFSRFDPLRTGSMGLQEFLAMTLFLRSTAATFKAFDPQGTGEVRLSFAQFVYAAVNSN